MRFLLPLLLSTLLCTGASAQQSEAYLKLAEIAHIEQKYRAPMRDGIRLATDIYRPKTDERVPIILSRTPYQMNGWVDGQEQREMETRNDILVYTTDPFADGVTLAGSIETTLYVSSDAKDTDFTVKLIDVAPDGAAYNLDETIQRVRYREGYDREVFMEKGEVYEVKLSPMTTANYFKPGHAVRIEVSSSNFPRFDRNMNTGGRNYDEATGVVARNSIHHGPGLTSHVTLPLISGASEGR